MAVIIECERFDPHVAIYRPHRVDGLWIIQVQDSPKNETNSYTGNGIGNISMTLDKLCALRDALNRELADDPPATVLSMDDETVPVAVCGLPEFADPTTAVEPKTEAWAR